MPDRARKPGGLSRSTLGRVLPANRFQRTIETPVAGLTFVLALTITLLVNEPARGACTCICVDGLNRPLCSSLTEPRPVCPPRVCPREPSVSAPLEQSGMPPVGTQSCEQEYVYNRYTQRYEWRRICQPASE